MSTTYPPRNTEGIARQRQLLARELAGRGHDVCVVTIGGDARDRYEHGVRVLEVATTRVNHYTHQHSDLDPLLTDSQALYEGLLQVLAGGPVDVVDVPLWAAQGFVTLQQYAGTTVLWLQTTTRQLLAINGQAITDHSCALIALERICLERAAGLLADSRSALESSVRDYQPRSTAPSGIAYLGLPPLDTAVPDHGRRGFVEALVVGRLEQRKGTPALFEVLPAVLREHPGLRVRFVGRDNSDADGWRARTGLTYPAFFQRRHPELAPRVLFEGYVDDEQLALRYQQADLVLAPSLYESFGLVYLEAMRAALPVITCASGAANEVFAGGTADGALLVPVGDTGALAAAIGQLARDQELRRELGANGRARFQQSFTAGAMADATLAFYERVAARGRAAPARAREVYQVMEALDVGDAVSNIARRNARILAELGQPPPILTRHYHPSLQREVAPLHHALARPGGLIFHYWGYNSSAWLLRAAQGPKAMYYHNITPPQYFAPETEARRQTEAGYVQLRQIAGCFDLVTGDSRYNVAEFARYVDRPVPMLHLYPVVDPAEMRAAPYDGALLAALRDTAQVNVVFVGRIARNKRQDQVIRLFDYYYREINRHARLWLVGSDHSDPAYRVELERMRESLPSGDRITLTGKVSDAAVNAYYRAADVFVCASEHEGFCVPLIQAMALDVPVLAYAAAAVPETMGSAGILIREWQVERLGELMHLLLTDERLRERIVVGQRANLRRFSAEEARARLAAIVNYLREGQLSELFEKDTRRVMIETGVYSNQEGEASAVWQSS